MKRIEDIIDVYTYIYNIYYILYINKECVYTVSFIYMMLCKHVLVNYLTNSSDKSETGSILRFTFSNKKNAYIRNLNHNST